jgi:hypothetical protein
MRIDRTKLRPLGVQLFLAGLCLVLLSMALFALFVSKFSEGYEGPWGDVVLGAAWLTLAVAVLGALAGLLAMLGAERSI